MQLLSTVLLLAFMHLSTDTTVLNYNITIKMENVKLKSFINNKHMCIN